MVLSGAGTFARLQLRAGASRALEYDGSLELGIYVMQGRVSVGDATLDTGSLGVLDAGDSIDVLALGDETAEVALLGGRPVEGEVLISGPFVMDTPERLAQARLDFASGRMGRLEGVPF